jgi:class 3 adenylate cyclase
MGVADLGAFMTGAHRAILEPFSQPPPTFVKNLGDGHLLLWETPPGGDPDLAAKVVAASARARAAFAAFVAGREAAGARLPRSVGIGVALGEVNRQDDYYGVALNLAARLQNLARPEGLALDRTVFEAAARRDDALRAAFRRARVRLKGLGATTVWVQRPFSWGRIVGRAARVAAVVALPLGYAALADAGLAVPGGDAVRAFLDGHEA